MDSSYGKDIRNEWLRKVQPTNVSRAKWMLSSLCRRTQNFQYSDLRSETWKWNAQSVRTWCSNLELPEWKPVGEKDND